MEIGRDNSVVFLVAGGRGIVLANIHLPHPPDNFIEILRSYISILYYPNPSPTPPRMEPSYLRVVYVVGSRFIFVVVTPSIE